MSRLLVVATLIVFLCLVAVLPSKSGTASGTPEAMAGLLLPGVLYLVALPGLSRRKHWSTAWVVVVLAAASFGAGLDSLSPDQGWRLLTGPLGLALLGSGAWIASPRGAGTRQRWWALVGAVLFGGSVLAFSFGAW